MFNNYFYLSRSISELDQILKDSVIIQTYSQEKNLLFIHIPKIELPDRHLIISTNPQSPFLLVKNHHRKAKKNVIDFFQNYLPARILSIKIASNDRIIKFETDTGSLLFSIKGKRTNIFYTNMSSEISFKKTSESISDLINCINFISGKKFQFSEKKDVYENFANLMKTYPMISKEIRNELALRDTENEGKALKQIFNAIVNEIFNETILIGYSPSLSRTVFVPSSFKSVDIESAFDEFSSFNEAFQFYLRSFYKQKNRETYLNDLNKYFENELSALANKLNKLKERIENGSKESDYYTIANLLLANKHNLEKGMDSILLTDDLRNKEFNISLNPKLSPQENVDRYFEKAKDEKVNFNKSLEIFKFTEQKYDHLQMDYKYFQGKESIDDLKILYDQIFKKKEKIIKMNSGLKFKHWHYIIEGKYNVYVGRDSKSNDYLSTKFAKQNDYWFHARGMPGSHVILRVENTKEALPKNIIKNAASLAAYHSKSKTAGTASVSYTFAKFVYKKKGMAPGKVFLSKEKTVLVKPEIPKNSELINE